MDTTFQPLVRVSDKSAWTTTELLLDIFRMLTETSRQLDEGISSMQELNQRVEQSTKKLDGVQ